MPDGSSANFGNFLVSKREFLSFALDLSNEFGKTDGRWRPSEGSPVFAHFFGGNHPSELASADFFPGKEEQYTRQILALEDSGRAFLAKNAWNSFRVLALKRADPGARFIWIRRSIFDAAESELRSRYYFGNLSRWSSATPANLEMLQQERPAIQALEQHISYSNSIREQLGRLDAKSYLEIWFEDFLLNPQLAIQRVASSFDIPIARPLAGDALRAQLHPRRAMTETPKPLHEEISYVRNIATKRDTYKSHDRDAPST